MEQTGSVAGSNSNGMGRRGTGGIAPILAGLVAGIDNVGFSIALAALMFAGPLAGGLGIAASAALLATAILGVALSARSGLRGNLGHVQDIGLRSSHPRRPQSRRRGP